MQGPVALFADPVFLGHDPGPGHPERADRLRAVARALDTPEFAALDRRPAPAATRAELERAHTPAHVDRVLAAVPREGYARIDGDTVVSPGWLSALE